MTTMTAPPSPSKQNASTNDPQPISLFELGALFVLRVSYWTCRAGNDPDELDLSSQQIEARALASFGTKDLIDPERGRRVFAMIEKRARHQLAIRSHPFPAANAHFVPWDRAGELIEVLESLRAEFQTAVAEFLASYAALQAAWRADHPKVPASAYPSIPDLQRRFGFAWHCFKVGGASPMSAVEDMEAELADRTIRQEQLAQMKQALQSECRAFVTDYVTAFRREVAAYCDQIIEAGGQVHGKTLQALRRRIDHFHAMNIFSDAEAAQRLNDLKGRIFGLTGEDLARQPDLAESLRQACEAIRGDLMDPGRISSLTGRLRRRVILE